MAFHLCWRHRGVAALLGVLGLQATAFAADDVADFYRGKQVRVIIGSAAGDGIDVLVRTVARHMGKHLPGAPTFLPQNMPGAGSRVAANWLYNVAPKDGSVIGNITQNTPFDQALKEPGIQFDVGQFNWIGNALMINSVILTWTASGLTTIDDVKTKGGLICGGSGGTSPSLVNPQILKNLTGADIRIISGYKGNSDIGLAMERGEVNCLGSTNLSSARVMFSSQLKERQMSVLVQYGTEKDPSISAYAGREVPLIGDLARDAADRRVVNLVTASTTFGRPLLAPPGTPAERVEALRRAFDAATKDPEFLAEAAKLNLDVNPVPGERLQKLAAEVAATGDDVVARAKALVALKDVTEMQEKK